jgi:hypothetical protein
MLFLRLIRFLLWPIRLPFILLGRLLRVSGRGLAGEAEALLVGVANEAEAALATPAVGAVGKMHLASELVDVRYALIFKTFTCPKNDEPIMGPSDLEIAKKMASRALEYYGKSLHLFPPDDIFYEEVEESFIDEVGRLDNDGKEDQFVGTLRQARRLTNDNTRILFCEAIPLVMLVILVLFVLALALDPFNMFAAAEMARTWQTFMREGASELGLAGGVLVVGALLVAFIYRFSYTHLQRANGLSLNAFITLEFARLNDSFRVAQREALQAETRLDHSQHDKVGEVSAAWTLAYHWIGVRQFMEELIVRNAMFQVRRNTTLYRALGVIICLGITLVTGGGALALNYWNISLGTGPIGLLLAPAVGFAFTILAYGLATPKPFAIIASVLMTDGWNRMRTLAIGVAISEQVSRDKMQIVINRDRVR